ncbi:MAG: tetratricopeptide repeat protein [Pseudomonadales bacterium]|nr:tetratricopeptide repeat protein [Pseudomonadales bacterium]
MNIQLHFSLVRVLSLLFLFVSGLPGCSTSPQYQATPAMQKAQLEKKISSSVVKPKQPTIHQNTFSEAVNSLLSLASNQQEATDYAGAAASIERALRINPKSTEAYHRLAEVRLEQGRFGEAEQLARKAMSYVNFGNHIQNDEFKAGLWYLISVARSRGGNKTGAEKALLEAHKLEMRTL